MSSLTKHLFNHFCFKQVCLYKSIRNEIKFIGAQYYTFKSDKSARQSEVFEPKSLRVCRVFTLSNIKQGWSTLGSEFKEKLRNLFSAQKQKHVGYLWYVSLEVININEFFNLLEMPDTFYSRFKIMELHVWMLLYHLPQAGRLNKLVRYGLIEAMWLDTEKRARIVHKYNLNFKKNMKTFYNKFKVTLLLYDEGFHGDDKALANALWVSFFDRGNVDPRILEALVSYVRHQMNYLNDLDMKMLENSGKDKIWFPLGPHVEKIFNRH